MGLSVSLSFKCQRQQLKQQQPHRWKFQQQKQHQHQKQHELQQKHLHRKNHHKQQHQQQPYTPQQHQRGQKQQTPSLKQQHKHSCLSTATEIINANSSSNNSNKNNSYNDCATTATSKTTTSKWSSTSKTKRANERQQQQQQRTWPPVVSKISTHFAHYIPTTTTTANFLSSTTTRKTFSWFLATFLLTVTFIVPTTTTKIVPTAAIQANAAGTLPPATFNLDSSKSDSTSSSVVVDDVAPTVLAVAAATTTTTTTSITATAKSKTATTTTLEPPLALENIVGVAAAVSQEEDILQQEAEGSDDGEKSNEKQLLQFYQHAQNEQQQKHRHRQRDAPPETSFDDMIPTAGVVSTLIPAEGADADTATTLATTTTLLAGDADIKCEPKVLDDMPSYPLYDYSDLAEDAARQFTQFLATKFSGSTPPTQQTITEELREQVRRRANGIANYALQQDESLLAFAIAAPSIHTVVVKFRDNVTIPLEQIHNKSFLGSYWRELGFAWNSSDGSQEWGSPFRDCNLLKGRWLRPFRISYTEYKIKIVAAAFIAADVDVCNDELEQIFGRNHGCDRNTTFCLLTGSSPSVTRDSYTCICLDSYYLPNSTLQGFQGNIVEASEGFDNFSCIPCPGGCSMCDQNGVCMFGEPQEAVSMENLFRVSVGSVLGACILCCVVLGVIVFRQRKCKAIASGMWTVLETILLGIVLLYASVAVHFFPASTERCLLEPWLRELGFITCYGAIILKLYRHLVDFRTRKAHRWVLRDVDLLKYLGTMVFAVICYMAAFTASSLDLIETAQLEGLREISTNTCHPLKWDYVTQVSEALITCFGLHLAFASRNANTQFRERQFLVASLTIEFLVSSSYYVLRVIYLPELSPGAILLALFLRSQLTNTISLGLIFVPKLWYQHKQVRSLAHDLSIRLPVDAFKGSHDVGHHLGGGYAGLCLGDPDIGELTISEMSPEDIRAELKRLYTQLEILKNKTLRQDNPHISKRRGGRKAGHRRFSLQALSAKHRSNKHHQDVEITEAEPSRTPEDSVCSAEGPTDTYAEISGISHSMLSHSMVSHSVVSHSVVSHSK